MLDKERPAAVALGCGIVVELTLKAGEIVEIADTMLAGLASEDYDRLLTRV